MKFVPSDLTNVFRGFFLILVVCLLYLNTLESPFVLDDSQIFENNTKPVTEFSLGQLKEIASKRFHPQRFFPNLTLAINYSLNGHDVTGYHWFNIFIHAFAAVAVFLLLKLILSLIKGINNLSHGSEIAFLAALLWTVHPLQTNAVTYIIQRMTSMAALLYFLSVLCYFKARLKQDFAHAWYLYVLTAVFAIMALFSKENTAVLPITILAVELYFFQPSKGEKLFTGKNLLFGGLVLGGFLLLSLAFLGTDPLSYIQRGYINRDFTLGQRLLTEPRVIFHYLSLLVLPLPSRMNLAYDYLLSTGLMSPPQTFFAIIGLVVLAILVIVLFKRDRLTSFAIFWLLLNLIIESSFIPLLIIFEHRMYIPSVMLVCAGVVWCYRLAGEKVQLARWAVVGVTILFSLFTWQRNGVWKTEVSLWSDVVSKSPNLSWGHSNLGRAYAERGEYELAEKQLQKSIALDPDNGLGYLNLGVLYEKQNRLNEANITLNRALDTKLGDHARLYTNLALVSFKLGDLNKAIEYAEKAVELKPYRYRAYDILGTAYLKSGKLPEAEKVFNKAINAFPQKGNPYIRLVLLYEQLNRLPEALNILNKVFTLSDVNLSQAYNHLGIIYWRMNNLPASIQAAKKALELDPGYRDAYLTLGISYEDSGRFELAVGQFKMAWQKGLDMIRIYNDWATHQIRNNNPDRAILYLEQAIMLEPDRAESHKNLARAYAMKGKTTEAEREEKRYLELIP